MRSEESEQYKEHEKRMKAIQDSKRNMRVDMRPSVVARLMSKELVLIGLGLVCAVSNCLLNLMSFSDAFILS